MERVKRFLNDNNIEHTCIEDHIGTYEKLPFTDKEMEALSKFWSMPILKSPEGDWVIDNTLVRVY